MNWISFESSSRWITRGYWTGAAMLLPALGIAACGPVDDQVGQASDENVGIVEEAASRPGYLAVWRPGTGAQWWRSGMTAGEFEDEDQRLSARGYRIKLVDVYTYTAHCGAVCTEKRHQYTAVWEKGTGEIRWHYGLSNSAFADRADEYRERGLRVKALAVSGTGKITAVWRPGSGQERTWVDLTNSQLEARNDEYMEDGLQLQELAVSGDHQYYAKWGPGDSNGFYYHYGMSFDSLVIKTDYYRSKGYRLRKVDLRDHNYVAIWNSGTGGQYLDSGLTTDELRRYDQDRFKDGYRLQTLRVRKYSDDNDQPDPPRTNGMDSTPPAGEACNVWARAELYDCLDSRGEQSSIIKDGQIWNMACGATATSAKKKARDGFALGAWCVVDNPTPNCCEIRYL